MNNSTYTTEAGRTLITEPGFELTGAESMLVWNALGLAGEAGEVANLIKKRVFHRRPISAPAVIDELGDVLWYINAICLELGTTISAVMEVNITKLKERFPNGWDPERSQFKTKTEGFIKGRRVSCINGRTGLRVFGTIVDTLTEADTLDVKWDDMPTPVRHYFSEIGSMTLENQ